MSKEKIITTYIPAPKAIDFDQFTNKWSAEGWIVKQISTSPIEVKDGRGKGMVDSYIGILDPMINDDRKIPIYKFILNIETFS